MSNTTLSGIRVRSVLTFEQEDVEEVFLRLRAADYRGQRAVGGLIQLQQQSLQRPCGLEKKSAPPPDNPSDNRATRYPWLTCRPPWRRRLRPPAPVQRRALPPGSAMRLVLAPPL